jgi:hypothetical protein
VKAEATKETARIDKLDYYGERDVEEKRLKESKK